MSEMATETVPVHSVTFLSWLVGDLDIPCDFFEDGKVLCQGEAAEWIMHRNPCCVRTMAPALACDCCKEARVNDMIALECRWCGHIWENAPDAYSMIEKIDRRVAR